MLEYNQLAPEEFIQYYDYTHALTGVEILEENEVFVKNDDFDCAGERLDISNYAEEGILHEPYICTVISKGELLKRLIKLGYDKKITADEACRIIENIEDGLMQLSPYENAYWCNTKKNIMLPLNFYRVQQALKDDGALMYDDSVLGDIETVVVYGAIQSEDAEEDNIVDERTPDTIILNFPLRNNVKKNYSDEAYVMTREDRKMSEEINAWLRYEEEGVPPEGWDRDYDYSVRGIHY